MDALSASLLAQEPRVFRISLQSLADSYGHFCSIDATLNIAVYVTALVRFCEQIMEVKHRYRAVLCSEIRIVVVVTTHIVNLTICDEKLRYSALLIAWQCLIKSHSANNLSKLCLAQPSLRK